MKRRTFCRLTATTTGGFLIVPNFLGASAYQINHLDTNNHITVFIQLNGGNDGLNTLIPYEDDLYYHYRPLLGIDKNKLLKFGQKLGWHPALMGFSAMAQAGDLSVIQNVGYPNPNRSHFRSQEIWQTASDSHTYLDTGWLGRFMEIQCKDQIPPAVNVDDIDNLALKAPEINSYTIKDFSKLKASSNKFGYRLSDNPQLDFVRQLALASKEGAAEIESALKKSERYSFSYAKNGLAKNLQWISQLIKGEINTKIFYTSLNGFDTHNNQLQIHHKQLTELNDAVYSFYADLKAHSLLDRVTIIIFSEFGRRVKENGSGTDHGAAAPVILIGGNNKNTIMGNNPNLSNLAHGDLKYEIDFRSVYATLLNSKFNFNPELINIQQKVLSGLF